ncbi:FAD-binding oxidoreductase [Rhizobium sp. TRM95111]|uniref:NAD(P)/FAD-dependent oxidoreductase n=1 Tax=Rhizobium alarense TaxID=2846851 RepID=UPI001F45077D|nr:FAD-binding oxidoreductase [Rhizobium alarense]MCF3639370.1 FAD-binding oxidoreductase [Rhizobium alarense]
MTGTFDFIVVGKGMMGAAAARHLASSGASVALVGPDEPADRFGHDGVFASHYDNGRITRTIDGNLVWARLANRSIARYREIERHSGIDFYAEDGCLISGPVGVGRFMDDVVRVTAAMPVDAPVLAPEDLAARFPWFSLPPVSSGLFEAKGAGWINPRALVAAQVASAEKHGATTIREEAATVHTANGGAEVRLRGGAMLSGGRVLVSAGGFSNARGLLPRPLHLTVYARTVILAEVGEADLPALSGMPCWIDESRDARDHFYLLPPVRYPDGRHYIKIGGDPTDIPLSDEAAVRAWFRTDGDAATVAHLTRLLSGAVPGFTPRSIVPVPCVTTYTKHGKPYVGFVDGERIAVVTGGNGAAAKSSDEIGRLGAVLVRAGRLDEPDYDTNDFAVHFA